ncbi:MAG: heparinase II/III family protein [Alistipes sp.]
MKFIRTVILFLCLLCPALLRAQIDTTVFALLDLSQPALHRVATAYRAGQPQQAAEALLNYYQNRQGIVCPDLDPKHPAMTADEKRWADEGLEHRFFVHTGYQPSCFYGKEIDWQYWPIKDNELRWQLHRTKWWVPMGKAYRLTGEEVYAKEWVAQYLDWIKKNPLTHYVDPEKWPDGAAFDLLTADNVYFAWRPLEVSDRLEAQIQQFLLFLSAPSFNADFLSHFLVNYHLHAKHISENFSAKGNHLLFQAQRLLYAATFFPELKEAADWRRTAIEILNREISKQVYDDGMQYELDPHYHLEAINIFFNALRMCDANGFRNEFPSSYLATVEKMIEITFNYSFPDYTNPMFSDAKLHLKEEMLLYYKEWSKVFPEHPMIRWMATEGERGQLPATCSQAFPTSGFYILRNGWQSEATVMVLKAGPPAFWHNQPDNGTFELWHRGRNFFPDSGSCVYAGDKEVNALRNWFRQTRVHNTLTLDDRNLEKTDSKCLHWSTTAETDVVTFENPSYNGLTHRRTVFFVDHRFFVLVDEAYGVARGRVALHHHLIEGALAMDTVRHSAVTQFKDGNNLMISVFSEQPMHTFQENGWVSRSYRERSARPSLSFEINKTNDQPVRFITLILPVSQTNADAHRLKASFCKDGSIMVHIGHKNYHLINKL